MIVGLLLAAGRSERFGSNKLLYALPGKPPLALLAARCLTGLEQSLAVIPTGDQTLRALFQKNGLTVVEVPAENTLNPGSAGLSASLQTGLLATPWAQGWIIALADMPSVQTDTVVAIRNALNSGAPIVACRYRGQRGNPVGFSRHFWGPLMALQGDAGARQLLETHHEEICWLDIDDPGILRDIDVPADWVCQDGGLTSRP